MSDKPVLMGSIISFSDKVDLVTEHTGVSQEKAEKLLLENNEDAVMAILRSSSETPPEDIPKSLPYMSNDRLDNDLFDEQARVYIKELFTNVHNNISKFEGTPYKLHTNTDRKILLVPEESFGGEIVSSPAIVDRLQELEAKGSISDKIDFILEHIKISREEAERVLHENNDDIATAIFCSETKDSREDGKIIAIIIPRSVLKSTHEPSYQALFKAIRPTPHCQILQAVTPPISLSMSLERNIIAQDSLYELWNTAPISTAWNAPVPRRGTSLGNINEYLQRYRK